MFNTTTISLEFPAETRSHLKDLEHQLKHIRHVQVELIEPKDHTAPALMAVGLHVKREEAAATAQQVAQVLHTFIHTDSDSQNLKRLFLVTIEGERVDIEPLAAQELERILVEAYMGV